MTAVARLITCTDLHDWPGQPPGQLSFSAVLKAELADGREVVLLEDRGWSESVRVAGGDAAPDRWSGVSREGIEDTARTVVGPDEPVDGQRQEDAARQHWSFLAARLEEHGVAASAEDLRSLAHVVALSDRLEARLAGLPPA